MKTDLLKEAIADADAIKKLAIENAKASLNQAFDSKIKSMLAARLQEEADETEELEEEVEETDEAKKHSSEDEDSKEDSKEDAAEPEDVDEIDINKILAEMEDEEDGEPEMEEPEMEEAKHEEEEEEESEEEGEEEETDEAHAEPDADNAGGKSDNDADNEGTDEEVDLNALLKELEMEEGSYEENKDKEEMEEAKEEDEEDDVDAKMKKMKEEHAAEIAEIKSQAAKLAGKVNETNLINAKLLYLNKILHKHNLNEAQKVKVIAAFDKATTVKEAKIVFESLNEAFVVKTEKSKTNLKESLGFASKAAGNSTKREIITEADVQVARWQKLAGINKTI